MARITYAINAVPRETYSVEYGTGKEVMATEVGRSVGGSGIATVSNFSGDANVQGFDEGAANYRSAGTSGTELSGETTASFIHIRNTGFLYSSASALGEASTESVEVLVGSTRISILDPGESIVLKDDNAGINASNITVKTVSNAGGAAAGAAIAVEFLVCD